MCVQVSRIVHVILAFLVVLLLLIFALYFKVLVAHELKMLLD
jgi:hypothetical protein